MNTFVFFLTIYFLNKITCFNLVVTWGGEKNDQITIEVFGKKFNMFVCMSPLFILF